MTREEIKAEAEKLGYKLVKHQPYERLLPCTCGCNRRKTVYYLNYQALVCTSCGKMAKGFSREQAKRNWNEMIRKEALGDEDSN